jgi:hypothetical protein
MEKGAIIKKITGKLAIDVFFIIIVIAMGIFFHWKIAEIAAFSLFIWIIFHPISSRYLASVTIFFLVLTPVFLISGKNTIADQLAIYAYYFLIMAVMMGIYELKKNDEQEDA